MREGAPKQLKVPHVPGSEFDETKSFPLRSALGEGVHNASQQLRALPAAHFRSLRRRSNDRGKDGGLGDDCVLRNRGQHLSNESRSAARRVKDETGRSANGWQAVECFQQGDAVLLPMIGIVTSALDGLVEEWFEESLAPEMTP
jgi:hypothetical protein